MLGLIDRFDLLAGALGTGIECSGSQDPFALRRAGGIFVKMIRAFQIHFSLSALIEESGKLYGSALEISREALKKKIESFLQERIFFETGVKSGTRSYEILQAVLAASMDDIADVFERYGSLEQAYEKDTAAFIRTVKVVERTGNILKGVKGAVPEAVDTALFETDWEKRLNQILEQESSPIGEMVRKKDYAGVTRRFGDRFYVPIHDFFDHVMINVEKSETRANRQAMMRAVNQLYTRKVADLSLLSRFDEV